MSAATVPAIPEWVHDALVIANPAAAVGGRQAGIYTPATNGIRPWRAAAIRWLTGKQVMGNTAVLVRQEGCLGGAGLDAVVDPGADYLLEVTVFVPDGRQFGEAQDDALDLWLSVFEIDGPGATLDGEALAEVAVGPARGDWHRAQLPFHSGRARSVRCIVRARAPRRLPCAYYAEDFRLTRTDQAWWCPQNVFDASRTAARLPDRRPELCATLDPDVVAGHNAVYLNWDGFFSRQGSAIGGGFWEQEYNHAAYDDPATPQFLDDGVARQIDGQAIVKSSLWPGYHMCHNAPGWHAYQQQRAMRIAPEVDAFGQDNISRPSIDSTGKGGCFCRGCRDGFRRWLAERWTEARLRDAGIADITTFDVAAYVGGPAARCLREGADAVLADPVLREFIQFQYASQLGAWRDTVGAIKRAAGHPVAVYGNQWGSWGQRPYSVALSQIGDVVGVETPARPASPQSRAWDALSVKLSDAAGEYRRPVWLFLSAAFHAGRAARSRLRSEATLAWANGGVPTPWATAPGASGWFYDVEASLCRFAQRHRALLARRERYANVGLVYSLPTLAWRAFPAFGLSPEPYLRWFGAWARLLEETRIPYEVVCWTHPLLGNDAVALRRLYRYQALIVPGADCLSAAQLDAVRAFQARGGRVIAVADTRLRDADGAPRPPGETLAGEGDTTLPVEVEPAALDACACAGGDATSGTAAREMAARLVRLVRDALGTDNLLETDAPPSVWANLWLDDTWQILSLHLVNADVESESDRLRPAAGSWWRVRLPAGLLVDRALAISPDPAPEQGASSATAAAAAGGATAGASLKAPAGETTSLPVEVSGGWATVTVPQIESYTIVALYAGQALAAAADLARARRALWRSGFARGPRGHGGPGGPGGPEEAALRAEVDTILARLRQGQVNTSAPAAADLARRSESGLAAVLAHAAPHVPEARIA